MRDREVFRWAFAISGLWLILSPFLFLGGASSFGTDVIGEAATFVIMGLMASPRGHLTTKRNYLRQDRLCTHFLWRARADQ
jgi:hypothetical protein